MTDFLPPFIYFTLWIPYSLILYLKPEKGGNPFSVAEPPCIGHYKEYLPWTVSSDFICWLLMNNCLNKSFNNSDNLCLLLAEITRGTGRKTGVWKINKRGDGETLAVTERLYWWRGTNLATFRTGDLQCFVFKVDIYVMLFAIFIKS